jgi:hypothetical protein
MTFKLPDYAITAVLCAETQGSGALSLSDLRERVRRDFGIAINAMLENGDARKAVAFKGACQGLEDEWNADTQRMLLVPDTFPVIIIREGKE